MFIDEAHITVSGGKGGDGNVSFFPGIKTGPSGGKGGKGGDIFVMGEKNMVDLYKFISQKKYKANDGKRGENFRREGASADNLILKVPVGTLLTDTNTQESFEVEDDTTPYLIARGGRGGRGNASFATSTHQSPKHAEPGEAGEERSYNLVLKLIADFGLIGIPNAGKSSILNELTAAHVKTAMYPFTTLEPNLGAFDGYIIADIPGLIEGASKGKGLGIKFLKHIEKVSVLLHCIAADSADPAADYETVINELGRYNDLLLSKKQVIVITKSDLVSESKLKQIRTLFKKYAPHVIAVSIYNPRQFEDFRKKLLSLL